MVRVSLTLVLRLFTVLDFLLSAMVENSMIYTITPKPAEVPNYFVKNKTLTKPTIRYGGYIRIKMGPTRASEENSRMPCKRKVMKRHVGNRQRGCSTRRPVKFSECMGYCIPPYALINPKSNFELLLKQRNPNYKCLPSHYVTRKVKVYCPDDHSITIYRTQVVKECKCQINFANFQKKMKRNQSRKDENKTKPS